MNDKIALVTGIRGFVGPYLARELESNGYEVYGLDIKENNHNDHKIFCCDLTDFEATYDVIKKVKPDYIFHLAGFSSVAKSFENPELCFKVNVTGFKNLLEATVKNKIRPKILLVSSSEIYGKPKYTPIDEQCPVAPISPYGESRAAQESLCKEYDLPIVISRSFGHTGPDQQDTFVIPSFRKQVKEAKDQDTIYVGNLDVIRDFSDVRDVVKAYRILLEKGKVREIYNVGSGNGFLLKDVLNKIIRESGKELTIQIDPNRYRKADIEIQVCNPEKMQKIVKTPFRKIFDI
jgi:GDP-4-dehydro-6-deoxy-D-mannose reductase